MRAVPGPEFGQRVPDEGEEIPPGTASGLKSERLRGVEPVRVQGSACLVFRTCGLCSFLPCCTCWACRAIS